MALTLFKLSWTRKALLMLLRPWLWSVPILDEHALSADPIEQFGRWYKRALRCFSLEFPEAMCLSTVDQRGFPDGRFVLLKGFDERGFVFYTNVESEKGKALEALPRAALTFYWEPLQRQVRIQGTVEHVSDAEADEYFGSRVRLSRIGAWASQQSRPLAAREELDRRVAEFRDKYRGQAIPRPPYWIGYRLTPLRMEFWQLRANRLHDRFRYEKTESGEWQRQRLYP